MTVDLISIDTNIAIYAIIEHSRSDRAMEILDCGPVVSVQLFNEVANVLTRKMSWSWPDTHDALGAIALLVRRAIPLTMDVHVTGLRIAERHSLALCDALIIAAALEAESTTLYSEDMHHGLVIDDRLTIMNPFTDSA